MDVPFLSFTLFIVVACHCQLSAAAPPHHVYVVYMGGATRKSLTLKESLMKDLAPIRTYERGFAGFAARMSEEEARSISVQPGVTSVFPDTQYQLLTTRSWEFLEQLSSVTTHPPPAVGSRSIVALLDSGIWPESKSFRSKGFDLKARGGWNGTCMVGKGFNSTSCNGKILGARYYVGESARDLDGHGSHVASTAAGLNVEGASYYQLAAGTAKGGAEASAGIAVYKVCAYHMCDGSAILAAFDDAIGDGVDVISVSIGSAFGQRPDILQDPIAIGAFHAVEHGITVVCAAGNAGPSPSTIENDLPWIITVAASTVDRDFQADVALGRGGGRVAVKGEGIVFSNHGDHYYPLIDGQKAKEWNASVEDARYCIPGSLKNDKVRGKILVCEMEELTIGLYELLYDIKMSGAKGLILVNNYQGKTVQFYKEIPVTVVSAADAGQIFSYINSTRNPVARLLGAKTVPNVKPAPEIAYFSSRGPSERSHNNIIKPDVAAPGVAILAAWTGNDSDATPEGEKHPPSFNIESGTSMACPHVAGVATRIIAARPSFSPSAVKSAIMTTAFQNNNMGKPITTDSGEVATPHDMGSGELNPIGALNPGLVYRTSHLDYLLFLCHRGYNTTTVRSLSRTRSVRLNFSCPRNSRPDLISQLNYPSISLRLPAGKQSKAVSRVLTNVAGDGNWTYTPGVEFRGGSLAVEISPGRLHFTKQGEAQSYKIRFSRLNHDGGQMSFGTVSWSCKGFGLRSPFVVFVG